MKPLVESKTNFWGKDIVEPLTIVRSHLAASRSGRSSALATAVDLGLDGLLKAIGAPGNRHAHVKEIVLRPPETIKTVSDYEVFAHEQLKKVVDEASWRQALKDRTDTIVRQIRDFVPKGATVLDVGCGDGMVGWSLRQLCGHIEFCDVVDYVNPDIRQSIGFNLFEDGEPLPVKRCFDKALVITVLHHTRDPRNLLNALKAKTKELLIIESVYFNEPRRFFPRCADLQPEDQFAFASYFDWFYNRVINRGVPVTYNYGTPTQWKQLLDEHGFEVTMHNDESFGVDIPLVPEYHMLIKAKRKPTNR